MIKKYFKYILFIFAIVFLTFDVQAKIVNINQIASANKVVFANEHGGGAGSHATVSQSTEDNYRINMCNDANVVRVMRLIGYILIAVKILVPIGLIIFGAVDFTKAMIANDESTLKKVTTGFAFKIIAAVVIFVLPTIINFIISFIDGANENTEKFEPCRVCIFDPKNCTIPK